MERRKLGEAYARALCIELWCVDPVAPPPLWIAFEELWQFARATPEQRARAALAVLAQQESQP
jgi:hypothetical protein